jgi:hypothetical protein
MISRPKAQSGQRGTLAIELALVKPVGVSRKFLLLDVATSSHTHTARAAITHTAQVPAFDNLGDDSSPDVRDAPSPGKTMEKPASPLPSVSSEFLCFSSTIFTMGPHDFFL